MARILISTLPVPGHVIPSVAAATKLRAAGHDVTFAIPEEARAHVTGGFPILSTGTDELKYDPSSLNFSSIRQLITDVAHIRHNLRDVLGRWTISQHGKVRDIAAEYEPDLIISDCLHVAPLLVALERGIPSIVLGVTPYRNIFLGRAPVRSSLGVATTAAGKHIYHSVNRFIQIWFRDLRRELTNELLEIAPHARGRLARAWSVFSICEDLGSKYLQCSSPSLEDDAEALKGRLTFIGPLNSTALSPAMHQRMDRVSVNANGRTRVPTVVVTWGTMQKAPPKQFLAITHKLCKSGRAYVVIFPPTQDRHEIQRQHASGALGTCSRIASTFAEFIEELKKADVFVSNGGFGTVKLALTLGVPVVCFGNQDDKPDVCGRVRRAKVGRGFAWFRGKRRVIRAIRQVSEQSRYAARAREVGWELSKLDASQVFERVVSELLGH